MFFRETRLSTPRIIDIYDQNITLYASLPLLSKLQINNNFYNFEAIFIILEYLNIIYI